MRLLTDPDLRLDRDSEQVGLELDDLDAASGIRQLLERRPLLPVRGHPLALVGADHTDPGGLRVLDATRFADPHSVIQMSAAGEHHPRL